MANPYYTVTGTPLTNSQALSLNIRNEFLTIQAAFDKLPSFTGTAGLLTLINSTGNGITTTSVVQISGTTTTFAGAIVGTTATFSDGAVAPINYRVGFREIPQVLLSANYTTLISDAGKHLYHPVTDASARTWTIDSNANVPHPIGTAITFANDVGAGVVTIAITADTLVLAGAGTTGSRTLAAGGVCTALKVTATRWMISGTGLT